MTTMGLEIGGAETHIVELSRELTRLGHTVFVASQGGVYEKELESADITHVKLPLSSKTPSAVIRSYFGLKRLIKQEKFDIVHAHARIPAAICGLLAKKLGFKFITTAHYDFKVTPFYKRVTDWGEYQLAVSHDLKNYLIEKYGLFADNISVTINGIDTEKFNASKDITPILDEFSLSRDKKRVLYVGRIDKEVAHAALVLAENAHRIAKAFPGVQVVIVGAGTAFDELKTLAERSNEIAGYRCVTLAGARTDISSFVAMCDVFVGVSRAALEAMAAKRPTVLAGAQGYIGIFDESKLELARENNFTCRGEIIPDGDMIVNDVCKLLSMEKDELEAIGAYNHEVVKRYYSVSKMASDYLEVYNNCGTRVNEFGEVIISGYYGFYNLGDDTLLRSLIASLRREKPDIKITVLSSKPYEMRSLYGVRTVNRYNIIAIIKEMKKARLLINGGGNLIQDGTSRKSLFYYTFIMKLAKLYGLKLALYANGIGPLYNKKSKRLAAEVINTADMISLRDPESLELIREIGCNNAADRARISADPAFSRLDIDDKWIDFILSRAGLDPLGKYFMVSVRSGNTLDNGKSNYDTRVINELSLAVKTICEKYSYTPIFVPFQSEVDDEITAKVCESAGCGAIMARLSASELCGILKRCELAISMRLHLLIFAASHSIPMIGVSYDKKVDSFMRYVGANELCDVRSFTSDEVIKLTENIVVNSAELREKLEEKSREFASLTSEDAKIIVSML